MNTRCPNPDATPSGRGSRDFRHVGEGLVALAVARAKNGDRSAFQFLYIRYATEVHRWVNSIVRDHQKAEDITHDVFVKLMRAIGTYTKRDVPFAVWLRRVARNAALDSLRSKRTVPLHDLDTGDPGREELRCECARDLRQGLGRLPYEQREVLILRHLAGLSPGEVAQLLGKTEASVHALQHRGRKAFKATLRELEAVSLTKS
jgi:RNA polymerase sigma-70 factor (ECF subfamily)